jgi:hypothetical protein
MSEARKNHYVPKWYQEGFLEPGQANFAYLDMRPSKRRLKDGHIIVEKSKFNSPPSRCFYQTDLYSTFFCTSVNDEVERYLFGTIDTAGAKAVRAFTKLDLAEWHRHLQMLFAYIDIQKIRTPKGLDWLKAQYHQLTQNELMIEMQAIQTMHCNIWAEGVREIVSAEDAGTKFIISDHPVTIYNHAIPPEVQVRDFPNDPGIALKGSQTIFPLNRDFCLIFTNLEYAKNPTAPPLEKRTFARNFRNSIVRTDAFIRTRKLVDREVMGINYILKTCARRYVAAGREEWLYPEESITETWAMLRNLLLPPKNELWHFGGEIFAQFESGRVHYQDEFGRTEKEREFLKKSVSATVLPSNALCGCGSGLTFKACCKSKSLPLRPSWKERSIRERNFILFNIIIKELELDSRKDWEVIRRELTDTQISNIYSAYDALWPLETDLIQLLPKPDGLPRAVYTGLIHPSNITRTALGASLYFGEILIEHPFMHPRIVKKEFSPIENPRNHHQEFIKNIVFLLNVMPLVDAGMINLIPNPGTFDTHLNNQSMRMAQERANNMKLSSVYDHRLKEILEEDVKRSLMMLPRQTMEADLRKIFPKKNDVEIEKTLHDIQLLKEHDPLAVLRTDVVSVGKEGGQLTQTKLAPNFEIALYLAQLTGACIITDSEFRWQEMMSAIKRQSASTGTALIKIAQEFENCTFRFLNNSEDIIFVSQDRKLAEYPEFMRDVFKYLSELNKRGPKPNWEAHLLAAFRKAHKLGQAALSKQQSHAILGRIHCAFPLSGIQDNTVNRLLLMSSSDQHLQNIPMVFFLRPN